MQSQKLVEAMMLLNTSRLQMTTWEIDHNVQLALNLVATKQAEIEAVLAELEALKVEAN